MSASGLLEVIAKSAEDPSPERFAEIAALRLSCAGIDSESIQEVLNGLSYTFRGLI